MIIIKNLVEFVSNILIKLEICVTSKTKIIETLFITLYIIIIIIIFDLILGYGLLLSLRRSVLIISLLSNVHFEINKSYSI